MDYKERFRNILKRLNSDSNREHYNAICTLPSDNADEKRVWDICKEFWGKNEAPLDIENYDVKDAFVSMVYLYDDQTMKIEFNCEDVIRRALEKYGA